VDSDWLEGTNEGTETAAEESALVAQEVVGVPDGGDERFP